MRMLCVTVACLMLGLFIYRAEAQVKGTTVRFDIENTTLYAFDCPFPDLGTKPNKLDGHLNPSGIGEAFAIGDITSVNGKPFKGTAYGRYLAGFGGSPNPAPGRPIIDGPRAAVVTWDLDFLNPDSTQIGTIHIDGLLGGSRPPGAPKEIGAAIPLQAVRAPS